MLSWLKKRFERSRSAAAPRRARPTGLRVSFDDDVIVLRDSGGPMASVAWNDLAAVVIQTTEAGPFEPDLFWVLHPREHQRSLIVAMGAEGEHDLLQAMQARLSGFDNMAVIEAMGTTTKAAFTVWEAPPPVRRPVV